MGFDAATAGRVARLVRLHLLLPEVATTRDLDDPAEITRVAELVGDSETIDGLLLLSLADARATGPSAYSTWKDSLLDELHARVRRHLDGSRGRRVVLADPDVVVADARRLAGDAVVEALLPHLPRRYLFAADADQLAAHAS